MINYGLIRKTFGDSTLTLCISFVGLIAFVILFAWAMLNMGQELMEFVSTLGFVKKIMEMSLGLKLEGELSINMLFAVCFTHGIVLTTVWGVLIATVTRCTAGEVERGTADILLSLPISRANVFCSTTVVWIVLAAVLSLCPIVGIWLSVPIFQPEEVVEIHRYVAPTINFFCLNLAIAAMSSLVGSLHDRRGIAVGIIVSITLVSVVLNFLEPFIEALEPIMFLSFLNYFRPVDVVREGIFPVSSCIKLLVFALTCWFAGMFVFCRKDIPTA